MTELQMEGVTKRGLIKLFHQIDKDGDDMVSTEEMRSGLLFYGFDGSQLEPFLNAMDSNKDHNVSFEEFKAAFQISPEELREPAMMITKTLTVEMMHALFKRLDRNEDGMISRGELLTGLVEPKEAESFMNYLDMNGDGVISRDEYNVALCLASEESTDWHALFNTLDADRSGKISLTELKRVFDRVGMPILNSGIMEWISEHDRNHDGELDYKEFLSFIGNLRSLNRKKM